MRRCRGEQPSYRLMVRMAAILLFSFSCDFPIFVLCPPLIFHPTHTVPIHPSRITSQLHFDTSHPPPSSVPYARVQLHVEVYLPLFVDAIPILFLLGHCPRSVLPYPFVLVLARSFVVYVSDSSRPLCNFFLCVSRFQSCQCIERSLTLLVSQAIDGSPLGSTIGVQLKQGKWLRDVGT